MGFEVHPIHDKSAVTQQALLSLAVKLLQNLPAVPWELHSEEGLLMAEEAGGLVYALLMRKSHICPFRKGDQVDQ